MKDAISYVYAYNKVIFNLPYGIMTLKYLNYKHLLVVGASKNDKSFFKTLRNKKK